MSDVREPCPRCGKKLKPLSPRGAERSISTRWDERNDPSGAVAIQWNSCGPPGTRSHACDPALKQEREAMDALQARLQRWASVKTAPIPRRERPSDEEMDRLVALYGKWPLWLLMAEMDRLRNARQGSRDTRRTPSAKRRRHLR